MPWPVIPNRWHILEDDQEPAFRLEHSPDFLKDSLGLVDVVQAPEGKGGIERTIRKRQIFTNGSDEVWLRCQTRKLLRKRRPSYPRPPQLASGLSPLRWRARPRPEYILNGARLDARSVLSPAEMKAPDSAVALNRAAIRYSLNSELDLWI